MPCPVDRPEQRPGKTPSVFPLVFDLCIIKGPTQGTLAETIEETPGEQRLLINRMQEAVMSVAVNTSEYIHRASEAKRQELSS